MPIDLKERRRYICVKHPEGYQLSSKIREALMKIGGIKCLSHAKFSVISVSKGSSVVRTSEGSVDALLTAILLLKYSDRREIEVMGISGNLRRVREICGELRSV